MPDIRTITNEEEYDVAVEAMLQLDLRYEETKDPAVLAEANALGEVVRRYEVAAGHTPADTPKTLREVLEVEMFKRRLRQRALAELLEVSENRLSELMRGKREMNIEVARKLYTKLHIPADVILQLH